MFNQVLQPGESRTFHGTGRYIRIDAGELVHVVTSNGHAGEMYKNELAEFDAFNSVEITNRGPAAEQIRLRVLGGVLLSDSDNAEMSINPAQNGVSIENAADIGAAIKVDAANVVVDSVAITAPVELAPVVSQLSSAPDVPVQPGQVVGLVADSPARRQLIIQAVGPVDELITVRISGADVGAGRGMQLHCGLGVLGNLVLDNVTGAIAAYSEGTQSVTLTIAEVK